MITSRIGIFISFLFIALCRAASDSEYPITCEEEVNSKQIICNGEIFTLGDHLDPAWSTRFWIDGGISIGLVLIAGIMSGLTMGLMSMDTLNLKIMLNGQDERQKKCAAKILPLVEKHHLLLVTLLLTNACAAEALPIFLDRLVNPAVAVAISVSMVLLFGEIIPQAVCTRFGLQVGAAMSWFVWLLIGALFPIAWPISKLLDMLLGHDNGTFFRRAELKELVHLHAEDVHAPMGENLTGDEVRIIKGALDMKEKTVRMCLTTADKIFAVNIDDKLDRDMLLKIVESGHHRIPVYHGSRDHFIGMILIQDLILIDPNASTSVRSLKLYRVPIVDAEMPVYDMLHQFQSGRSHMAVVLDPADHITPLGIVTLEDLMEELLQEEILDEEDYRLAAGEDKYDVLKDLRLVGRLRRGSVAPGRRGSMFVPAGGEPMGYPGYPRPSISGTPGGPGGQGYSSANSLAPPGQYRFPPTQMDSDAMRRKPSVAFARPGVQAGGQDAYRLGRRPTEATVSQLPVVHESDASRGVMPGILKNPNPINASTGIEQMPLLVNGKSVNSTYSTLSPPPATGSPAS